MDTQGSATTDGVLCIIDDKEFSWKCFAVFVIQV
jgi:hypothetical protein